MSEPIRLQVSTASLKKILEENPDVMLQLESMACEKIAEEITRKVGRDGGSYTIGLKNALADAHKSAMEDFKSRWRFPTEAKNLVETIAADTTKASLKEHMERAKSAAISEVNKGCAEAVDAMRKGIDAYIIGACESFKKEIAQEVRQLARDEFLNIMDVVDRNKSPKQPPKLVHRDEVQPYAPPDTIVNIKN